MEKNSKTLHFLLFLASRGNSRYGAAVGLVVNSNACIQSDRPIHLSYWLLPRMTRKMPLSLLCGFFFSSILFITLLFLFQTFFEFLEVVGCDLESGSEFFYLFIPLLFWFR